MKPHWSANPSIALPASGWVASTAKAVVCLSLGCAVFGCGSKPNQVGTSVSQDSPPGGVGHSAPEASAGAAAANRPTAPTDPLADWQPTRWDEAEPIDTVPAWAADAVFYQIFPERFRNGDPSNDPTHASLEFPESVPDEWAISPWTGDWYARAAWERKKGPNFYEHGVFDRRYGGDLQGVLDRLDYLQDLGVNVIYFNPVFYGRSLHKYDGASMHHIDPYFGPDPAGDLVQMESETSDPATWKWTAADRLFLKLIEEIHQRKMRVIIDGVFNHTGRDFFAFRNLREQQAASPYGAWYIVQRYDNPDTPQNEFRYKGWWGIDTLPEFADTEDGQDLHAGPKAYVMDITRRWMDPNQDGDPRDGIDGWRLDVANEVPPKFWQDWHTTVRQLNPAAYTVAEVWGDAQEFLTRCGFSATMNYHAFSYLVKGFVVDGRLSAHDFGRELLLRSRDYAPATRFVLQNLVDGHDTDRVASMIVNRSQRPYRDASRFDYDVTERVSPRNYDQYQVRKPTPTERQIQRLVALVQMTSLGAPMIYYGTEAGMWGADDPCDRMPMVWDDLQYDPQAADPLGRPRDPDPVAFDAELCDFYRQLIALRHQSPALRRGSIALVDHDDAAQFLAYERRAPDARLVIVVNRGAEAFGWSLPEDLSAASEIATVFATQAPEQIRLERQSDRATLTLPGLTGAVLQLSP
jgi:glycosidase